MPVQLSSANVSASVYSLFKQPPEEGILISITAMLEDARAGFEVELSRNSAQTLDVCAPLPGDRLHGSWRFSKASVNKKEGGGH